MPDSTHGDPRPAQWLPPLTAVGFFMQTLDGTILNTALPSMAETLGESPLQMQSVIIAYMLTVALLIPASGWLADRFGTRRIYLAAILLFTLAPWPARPPTPCRCWWRRGCCRGSVVPC